MINLVYVIVFLISFISCTNKQVNKSNEVNQGLRDFMQKDNLYIGTSIGNTKMFQALNEDDKHLIAREFNRFGGGFMKMVNLQSSEGKYTFEEQDEILNYCSKNGLAVHGHVLVYELSTPNWLKNAPTETESEKKWVEEKMLNHIEEVVGRFKGKVDVWEVVNETVSNHHVKNHKNTVFFRAMGEEFIDIAFHKAHETDSNAKLIINDNTRLFENEDKVARYYELVKRLIDRKVPIDGVGFQCHFFIDKKPDFNIYDKWFEKFADLEMEIYITELDVDLGLPVDDKGLPTRNPTANELEEQAKIYSELVRICQKQSAVKSIQFWGFKDNLMWRAPNGFALLFTENLEPKPAYFSVLETLKTRMN